MSSVLDSAKLHPKHSYKVVTGDMALAMSPLEFDQLYPAQRGFVNRARRQAGFPIFDVKKGARAIETKPIKQQLEESLTVAPSDDKPVTAKSLTGKAKGKVKKRRLSRSAFVFAR